MTVNHSLRRIASLSAFLVAAGIASISQAGIIPWAYDAVFGPVRSPAYGYGYGYGYSPYAVSYSRPVVIRTSRVYAPVSYGYSSGCSSCSTSYYAPVSYASPSYGCGCGPVVMAPSCGPCGSVSSASSSGCLNGGSSSPSPAPATSNGGKSAWKKPSEPASDEAPTPRTFQEPDRGALPAGATTNDGLGASPRSLGTRTEEGVGEEIEVKRPAAKEEEPTILNRKKAPAKTTDDLFELDPQPSKSPAKPKTDVFEPPLENNKSTDGEKENKDEATNRLPLPNVNLDAKIAWRADPQRTRVPLHAKIAKATVTRRAPNVDSDWTPVVAKSTGTHLVKK